jgi:hypothetical protein
VIFFIELLSTPPPNGTKELKSIANVRRLFDSCIEEDEDDSEDVNSILSIIDDEFGGWPILEGSKWDNSTFNFPKLMLKLNAYNTYAIFKPTTRSDEKKATIPGIRVRLSIYEQLGMLYFNI